MSQDDDKDLSFAGRISSLTAAFLASLSPTSKDDDAYCRKLQTLLKELRSLTSSHRPDLPSLLASLSQTEQVLCQINEVSARVRRQTPPAICVVEHVSGLANLPYLRPRDEEEARNILSAVGDLISKTNQENTKEQCSTWGTGLCISLVPVCLKQIRTFESSGEETVGLGFRSDRAGNLAVDAVKMIARVFDGTAMKVHASAVERASVCAWATQLLCATSLTNITLDVCARCSALPTSTSHTATSILTTTLRTLSILLTSSTTTARYTHLQSHPATRLTPLHINPAPTFAALASAQLLQNLLISSPPFAPSVAHRSASSPHEQTNRGGAHIWTHLNIPARTRVVAKIASVVRAQLIEIRKETHPRDSNFPQATSTSLPHHIATKLIQITSASHALEALVLDTQSCRKLFDEVVHHCVPSSSSGCIRITGLDLRLALMTFISRLTTHFALTTDFLVVNPALSSLTELVESHLPGPGKPLWESTKVYSGISVGGKEVDANTVDVAVAFSRVFLEGGVRGAWWGEGNEWLRTVRGVVSAAEVVMDS
ncbi:uncharacterized protein EV422DRAFT_527388 [Fimicolochytrium jonesii]|uniref:uncharacterized protein n=1 Tax=Fimicolochytrium jonesii TaxID=1396493 RepID=UPI0022FEB0B9|nr:uncharacterized protein EV422DRAFT_527388 [Fimicolochytrium jonesii]KAI8821882.1 hypothetical protein EV422DRAFT_527388 [Fimicolochytrium jonesii]